MSKIKFYNGMKMPAVGLGTWQSQRDQGIKAVKAALDIGYRHFDTAVHYQNEDAVGEALGDYIKAGKVNREEIFVVTKLPGIHMEASRVRKSLEGSLERLRLQYVDLYLVHTPVGFKYISDDLPLPMNEKEEFILDYSTNLLDIWKEMEKLVDAGLTKSVGISNFNQEQVERICNIARIKPVTNQIECHLYFPNTKLVEFCRKRDITITAFFPLGSPDRPSFLLETFILNTKEKRKWGEMKGGDLQQGPIATLTAKHNHPNPQIGPMKNRDNGDAPRLLDDQIVLEVARKYKKTPAQVLLRSLLQKGYAVIPKSSSPERIKENFQVCDFNISDEDMVKLDNMKHYPRMFGRRVIRDDHPEYPFASPD